ncbi:unannotated protein [freshwater metagenome]|uniref:Unannotated protein n=1 Tax=freshwater metagenome TaxID=449393 RepID=A0A6J7S7V2_9ZZZZ
MLDQLRRLIFQAFWEMLFEGVGSFDDVIVDAYKHHVIDVHLLSLSKFR